MVLTIPFRTCLTLVFSHLELLSLGRDRRVQATVSHGQTLRSPPTEPGDCLGLFIRHLLTLKLDVVY